MTGPSGSQWQDGQPWQDGQQWQHGPPGHGCPWQAGPPPAPGARQPHAGPVSRKEPAFSAVASLFFPGIGSFLNGQAARGIGFMALYLLLGVGALVCLFLSLFVVEDAFLWFMGLCVLALGVLVWSMIDAYLGARDHNRRHGLG